MKGGIAIGCFIHQEMIDSKVIYLTYIIKNMDLEDFQIPFPVIPITLALILICVSAHYFLK